MQILFIFSLLFAILVAIFAVLNSDPVTINLLWKEIPSRQSIVILGSAAIGAIIVALLGTFNKVKSSLKIRELNNKIKVLEKRIEELDKEEISKEEDKNLGVQNLNMESKEDDSYDNQEELEK